MSGLKLFLLTSAKDDFKYCQHFPLNFKDKYIISELVIISKHFKKCGKGTLINEKKIFYYRTYFPRNEMDKRKKKMFLLFYCDNTYKEKNIEDFTKEIFSLLERSSSFDKNNLGKETNSQINKLFKKYKNINEYKFISNINDLSLSEDDTNQRSITFDKIKKEEEKEEVVETNRKESWEGREEIVHKKRKRIDSRFYFSYQGNKKKLYGRSSETSNKRGLEMIKSVGNDTELTLLFTQDDAHNYWKKVYPWRNLKKFDMILCFFLFLFIFWVCPFLLVHLK